MKRLAFIVFGIAAAVASVPALAADLDSPRRAAPTWCERHADTSVDTSAGRHAGLVLGLGATSDREVVSGYACYDATFLGGERRAELVNAWWDPEYGTVGTSCVRQARDAVLSCRRTALSLPVEGTTPVTHEDEPWWLDLVEVAVDYRYEGGRLSAGVRLDEQCVEATCARVERQRAGAGSTANVRAAGRECRADGRNPCTRTEGGDRVVLGERGAAPLVNVNDQRLISVGGCLPLAVTTDIRC